MFKVSSEGFIRVELSRAEPIWIQGDVSDSGRGAHRAYLINSFFQVSRKAELIALLITDTLVLFAANLLFYMARLEWGWFGEPDQSVIVLTPLVLIITLLTAFWLVVFFFFGMYRERYAASRFDELVSLAKVVSVGILVLFLVLFIDQLDPGEA